MSQGLEMSEKGLLRTGSLCSPDPQVQLLSALNDKDYESFEKLLSSGVKNGSIDPNFWYDDPNYGTLLDIACQKQSYSQYITCLLKFGADPNKLNPVRKKSPLHFAVESGNVSYTNILLRDSKINVNILDNFGSSPLHYAAKNRNVDCMVSLINHPRINVNQANRKGETPVHLAAKSGTKESVLCLIQSDRIDVDSFKNASGKSGRDLILENYPELQDKLPSGTVSEPNLFNLLHRRDIDQFLKVIQSHTDSLNNNDGFHTFLQYSCEFGLYKVVETLLRLGADPNKVHPGNKLTPVMIASYKGFVNIVRLLLNVDSTKYSPIEGETVLHSVIKGSTEIQSALGDENELKNHYKCFELLLTEVAAHKLNINAGDVKGNTALHYAAKMNDKEFILLLLHRGAYIGQRNKLGEPALADVSPKIFETYLDNCLTTNDKLPREDNYEIIFRYNFLAPPKLSKELSSSQVTLNLENSTPQKYEEKDEVISETDPLLYMSRSADLRPLLKHPVLTSFLHLKWHRIRCFFYLNLTFYIVFWALLTAYILLAFGALNSAMDNQESNVTSNRNNTSEPDITNRRSTVLWILVTGLLLVLIIRELFQLTISPIRYLANPENWLEVGLIGVTISILFCNSCISLRHQISAIAILLSWAELVLLIGRHPALSTNIEMLKTVSWNFLKFLAWYSILIIAFALSFYTLFCDSESDEENYFVDPPMSIFKTVVMLTGEFDAGSIPFVTHPGTSHILFVLFVFLIAIVLFNLLNGLAVSDTQSIKADAELVGYVSRVKLVTYVETMVMGNPLPYHGFLNKVKRLFCCLPNLNCCTVSYSCLRIFSQKINLFPDLYPDCEIRILPNQESRIELFNQHKRKRQDVELDSDNCIDICTSLTMDPTIVHSAKQILLKKEDRTVEPWKIFEAYKNQLDLYKQSFDSLLKKNGNLVYSYEDPKEKLLNDFSDRLDSYKDTLNTLARNSERMEERLNQILKYFEQKKPFIGSSSSDEDNQ